MKRITLTATAAASLLVVAPTALAEPTRASGDASSTSLPDRWSAHLGDRADKAPLLRLTFNGGSASEGDVVRRVRNYGRASVDAVVVSGTGGRVLRTARSGGGWAVRLPTYSSEASPPRAVVRVENEGATDVLEARLGDFRFGAAFRLDAVSQGSRADNGDNLVQRGLSGDPAQYKLQLDGRVPVCRVQGAAGAVAVRAERISARRWYVARCYRDGPRVTIRVWRLTRDPVLPVDAARESGAIGSVDFAARTPLSVGGKLAASGQGVAAAADQFNGLVDHVVYDERG